MSETVMKTVIGLSDAYDGQTAVQLNAIGHLGQSLGHQMARFSVGRFVDYRDSTDASLGSLSWWPVIVLTGKPQKLQVLWSELANLEVPKALFTTAMISGGSEQQLVAVRNQPISQAAMVAIAAFGEAHVLNALTKKFSLWRSKVEV